MYWLRELRSVEPAVDFANMESFAQTTRAGFPLLEKICDYRKVPTMGGGSETLRCARSKFGSMQGLPPLPTDHQHHITRAGGSAEIPDR